MGEERKGIFFRRGFLATVDSQGNEQRNKLRQEKLKERLCLREAERNRLGLKVVRRVLSFSAFQRARCVALYAAIQGEVPTRGIFEEALRLNQAVFFPRVEKNSNSLQFFQVHSFSELTPGYVGIPEPDPVAEPVSVSIFDLIFVPGIVFDLRGYRLGYGYGFYDRALQEVAGKKVKVGLAFEVQLVPKIPGSPRDGDVRMDWIITEERILEVNSG